MHRYTVPLGIVLITSLFLGTLLVLDTRTPARDAFDWCIPADIRNETMYMDGFTPGSRMWRPRWFEMPSYHVTINQEGFRTDPINGSVADSFVILVLGDSFTFGVGVNASDRYTNRIERKLDERFDTRVQVINAGLPGAGMRDYYEVLYNKGVRYDPDIVITAFSSMDILSRQRHDRWLQAILDDMGLPAIQDATPAQYREIQQRMSRRKSSFLNAVTWNTSPIRLYGNRINRLAERTGGEAYFFRYLPGSVWSGLPGGMDATEVMATWEDRCGMRIISPPKALIGAGKGRYFLPDNHLNAAGHREVADQLYPVLERAVERSW